MLDLTIPREAVCTAQASSSRPGPSHRLLRIRDLGWTAHAPPNLDSSLISDDTRPIPQNPRDRSRRNVPSETLTPTSPASPGEAQTRENGYHGFGRKSPNEVLKQVTGTGAWLELLTREGLGVITQHAHVVPKIIPVPSTLNFVFFVACSLYGKLQSSNRHLRNQWRRQRTAQENHLQRTKCPEVSTFRRG
jgi:hypothetical protein